MQRRPSFCFHDTFKYRFFFVIFSFKMLWFVVFALALFSFTKFILSAMSSSSILNPQSRFRQFNIPQYIFPVTLIQNVHVQHKKSTKLFAHTVHVLVCCGDAPTSHPIPLPSVTSNSCPFNKKKLMPTTNWLTLGPQNMQCHACLPTLRSSIRSQAIWPNYLRQQIRLSFSGANMFLRMVSGLPFFLLLGHSRTTCVL